MQDRHRAQACTFHLKLHEHMHFCTLPGSAISGLVASLTKEKAKVHVDLTPLLKDMNVEDLPSSAQPKMQAEVVTVQQL